MVYNNVEFFFFNFIHAFQFQEKQLPDCISVINFEKLMKFYFLKVSETGLLESCFCKEGYTSDHCERCDVGYYGQPIAIDGSCHKCDCNDNNDLSVDGSCHPVTGDCYLCLNNTDGVHCEHCKPWFYGDALEAKNCTGKESHYYRDFSLTS